MLLLCYNFKTEKLHHVELLVVNESVLLCAHLILLNILAIRKRQRYHESDQKFRPSYKYLQVDKTEHRIYLFVEVNKQIFSVWPILIRSADRSLYEQRFSDACLCFI